MRILQITTAAPGWNALYKVEGDEFKSPYPYTPYPVAIWAIVEEDTGEQRVTGYSRNNFNVPDDELDNFIGWSFVDN